jgi:beta-lactamase class A
MPAVGRRAVVAGLAAVPLLGAAPRDGDPRLAALEVRSGGRLGVAIHDTGSGRHLSWRADERFPMMSTFKLLAVAALLDRVDHGHDRLDREIFVAPAAVVGHAPRTRPAIGRALSLAALCAAAIVDSDNGAANLLLAELGGPSGVTDYARTLDDTTTRLDRTEPALNEGLVGDLRDTTSPAAMLGGFHHLVVGTALTPGSRAALLKWLTATKTGVARLHAGLPTGWRSGDKTGTADASGTSNDVAIVWPPARPPLLIAAYLTRSPLDGPGRDRILAAVGAIAATV